MCKLMGNEEQIREISDLLWVTEKEFDELLDVDYEELYNAYVLVGSVSKELRVA